MKRIAAALAGGVLTFSAVYGMAASLNVTSDSLGAGTSTVAACQAAALNIQYNSAANLAYNATANGYIVTNVTIHNLQATCESKPYRITLMNGSASIGEVTGNTPASTADFTSAAFTGTTEVAANVTNVAMVITDH